MFSAATKLSISAYSPISLFAGGLQGYWLDPSDFSTMFQGAAGTTPVTAVGQSVGLMLDKSQGLTIGPELVTNGDFSQGTTGWTLGTGWAVTDGAAVCSATDTSAITRALNSFAVTNRIYKCQFDIKAYTSGSIRIRLLGGSQAQNSPFFTGAGVKTAYLVAQNNSEVSLQPNTSGFSGTIDNITVQEIPGNHFIQSNVANMPILGREPQGGRRNLAIQTEAIDQSPWATANNVTVVSGQQDPLGGSSATLLRFGTGTTNWRRNTVADINLQAGQTITFSSWMRSDTPVTDVRFFLRGQAPIFNNFFPTIFSVGTTWTRYSSTFTATENVVIESAGWRCTSLDLYVWGAQLELGDTATPYQRVGSAFDVTEAGVPTVHYLQFDGSDDFLQSAATINPGAVDKVQVFAGVRKLSDAAAGIFLESSVNAGLNAGSIIFLAPFTTSSDNYGFYSRGNVAIGAAASANGFSAPITNIVSGIGDISADQRILRVNGAQVGVNNSDQGTGNYLTYPHFIGRRGGTTLPFNGRIYQLITRFGPNLPLSTILQTEIFTNQRTGAY